jgi:hypothetical protein
MRFPKIEVPISTFLANNPCLSIFGVAMASLQDDSRGSQAAVDKFVAEVRTLFRRPQMAV